VGDQQATRYNPYRVYITEGWPFYNTRCPKGNIKIF